MTPKLWIRETIWVRIHQPRRMTKLQKVLESKKSIFLYSPNCIVSPVVKCFLGSLANDRQLIQCSITYWCVLNKSSTFLPPQNKEGETDNSCLCSLLTLHPKAGDFQALEFCLKGTGLLSGNDPKCKLSSGWPSIFCLVCSLGGKLQVSRQFSAYHLECSSPSGLGLRFTGFPPLTPCHHQKVCSLKRSFSPVLFFQKWRAFPFQQLHFSRVHNRGPDYWAPIALSGLEAS